MLESIGRESAAVEAATLTPSALGFRSFDRPGRCEPVVPRDREPRKCGVRQPPACVRETSAAALRYRRSERTALYIETQEGDVVRLRIKVRSALDAKLSQTRGEVDLDELRVNARSAVKISFSVDGELNAEELAAIRSVVAQASGLAAELFASDTPEAFATAAALEIDGAQLARAALTLGVREHLAYSMRGSYRPSSAPLPPPQSEPASSEPTTDAPVAEMPAQAPASPVSPSGDAVDATDGSAVPAATEPTAAEPVGADAPVPAAARDLTSAALDTIAKFIAHLLDSLAEPPPAADGDAPAIALSLKLRVFKSVALTLATTQVSAPDEPASGVPLLADTLDALAAHEEPLDARA